MTGSPRGRPTKLTPEAQEQITSLVRAGASSEVAAQAAGIGRRTFTRWMQLGESARTGSALRGFYDAVERARAEAESVLVTRIAQAASRGSWPAAAWLLERRFPERWMKLSERPLPELEVPEQPEPGEVDPFADVIELAKRRPRR
jgi:hypothetical protein